MTRYYLYKVKDTGEIVAKMLSDVSYEDMKKFEFEMQEDDNYKILSVIGVEYFLSDIVYLFDSLFKELEIPVKMETYDRNTFYILPISTFVSRVTLTNDFYDITSKILKSFNVNFKWCRDDIPTLTLRLKF